ncbi:MAG: hypothetical protein NC340_03580 [Ruminococcus flavefaciens]|nr:hypothetical protein [Ruminococcus flavefaciens]MCM1229636.1 hypothetical protein [Ruminococcus flavefaciens]
MDNQARKKMRELIDKNRISLRQKHLLDNALLRDCLEKITDVEIIDSSDRADELLDLMESRFQIEYHHVKGSFEISGSNVFLNAGQKYYIIWDNADLPVLKCSGADVLQYPDDIFAVDFDTYIVSDDFREIIHHDEDDRLWKYFSEQD